MAEKVIKIVKDASNKNEWIFEKSITLTVKVYNDVNGNGKMLISNSDLISDDLIKSLVGV